ncbi:MAG: hypothetical protein A2126_00590 [Candidatus Woykebacteria bacterium GWB1_45_5]|uniref:Bacterial Ig-like domain-containing protein n=2 Tax=Candidatus Woykeibacteriota TaxID=1817899 RepID=A0A1G1W3B9_9BACT|nr:MAG: hypothetical protein A2113_03515 [Candidatus Woykebacteria bacterium GWA1_44_8]OGY24612.1 MAG: hypothetical protein A2126_00590 [Candidatus Woykebacteria bacterium GWB1_45_5]
MIKKIFCLYLSISVSLLFFLVGTRQARADPPPVEAQVTITATVPETTVTFSGFAPASSTVTLKEGVVVIGTTTTNPSGVFTRTVVSSSGLHDFSLYYTDTAGRTTPETYFNGTNLPPHVDTPISNIHLPPTIALSKSPISQGESVLVFGQGAPGSTVHVFLNGGEKFSAVVGGGSDWLFTLSSGYNVGANSLYAYLTRAGLSDSVNSFTVNLQVNPCKRSDLNCDGYVNLTDFSILLYWWGSNNETADTNDDGVVGLIDFSIMMFDWTD